MKLALLAAADDSDAHALADAAAELGHAVSWREPPAATDSSVTDNAWEALLDPATADAVLVGGGDADARARQIQELVKLGRPVLTVHPVVPSVISFFEIDMARGESGAVVQHYNPLVEAPAVERLAAWIAEGHPQLGAVEQVVATRHDVDRSRARVVWHFARDVELLARLAGRLDRIGAHAATSDADSDAAYASLSVQLTGPRQAPVRWAIEPPAGAASLRVTLICVAGRATLDFNANGVATELAGQGGDGEARAAQPATSPAVAALGRFVTAVTAGDGAASTWPAALDAMELADSIEISLRRGRMIDVHHRELTEQLAFKGMMSAVGCGVLVVLIPAMLAAGWIAGLLGIPLSNYWPHLLLAALGLFLAVQLLPKLIPPAPQTAGRRPPDAAGEANSTD